MSDWLNVIQQIFIRFTCTYTTVGNLSEIPALITDVYDYLIYKPLQYDEELASPAQKLPVTGRRAGCNFLLCYTFVYTNKYWCD